MRILGIDPGLAETGWGVVEEISGHIRPISFGIIKTDKEDALEKRIYTLGEDVATIARKYSIAAASIEDIYFARNITSAVPVAKVIGAITFKLMSMDIPICYYSPLEVKLAVTGTGTADKRQVQEMVRIHLGLEKIPKPDHAADALADCICFVTHNNRLTRGMK